MLVDEGVAIVFHGHDHFFAKQRLDGIIYQECPQTNDAEYGNGCQGPGRYLHGLFLPNSGHLRVAVDTDSVRIDYIRSYLPGDGDNGSIAYSYTLSPITIRPDPFCWDSVIVGTEITDTLLIANSSTDTITVNQLVCSSDNFQAGTDHPFSIPADEALPVPLTFSPDSIQSYQAVLTLLTDIGQDSVVLSGKGSPLEAVQYLNTTLSRNAIFLSWEPIRGAIKYHVFRNITPLSFSYEETLATISETYFIDSNVTDLAPPGRYYVVVASNNLTQSASSNCVGAFERSLTKDSTISGRHCIKLIE